MSCNDGGKSRDIPNVIEPLVSIGCFPKLVIRYHLAFPYLKIYLASHLSLKRPGSDGDSRYLIPTSGAAVVWPA